MRHHSAIFTVEFEHILQTALYIEHVFVQNQEHDLDVLIKLRAVS